MARRAEPFHGQGFAVVIVVYLGFGGLAVLAVFRAGDLASTEVDAGVGSGVVFSLLLWGQGVTIAKGSHVGGMAGEAVVTALSGLAAAFRP